MGPVLGGVLDAKSVPLDFVRFHGVGLVDTVTLRGETGRHWLVECSLTILPGVGGRVECTGGWRSFAEDNELRKGDTLLFNLSTQDSFFIVRIPPTSCSGNHKPVAQQTEAAGAPNRKCTRRPSKSLHAVQFSATMTRSSSLGASYPFLVSENRPPIMEIHNGLKLGCILFKNLCCVCRPEVFSDCWVR